VDSGGLRLFGLGALAIALATIITGVIGALL